VSEDTSAGGGVLGFFLGLVLAGGSYFAVTLLAGASVTTALIVAAVAGAIGAVYGTIALSKKTYGVGFFSLLGFFLDTTWSLLNTLAGLLVWIPACLITGASFVPPTENSRRSGTIVYSSNPRGGGFGATTIGTVIAGPWTAHEETHVWQARIFGPPYMLAYIIALLLNMLFRVITGKVQNVMKEAYHRIPFEDWAYWIEGTQSSDIEWGSWVLGFFLTSVYTAGLISIPVGIAMGILPLWLAGLGMVIVYTLIRALVARGHPNYL
jgi:MFS family permease